MYSDAAYSPFGEPYAQAGTSDLSFTGENQDTVPGLYDFPFREYATQGRWPSPDPAGLAAVSLDDPRTWNRYAYVRNDPLERWDDGMSDDCPYEWCSGTPPATPYINGVCQAVYSSCSSPSPGVYIAITSPGNGWIFMQTNRLYDDSATGFESEWRPYSFNPYPEGDSSGGYTMSANTDWFASNQARCLKEGAKGFMGGLIMKNEIDALGDLEMGDVNSVDKIVTKGSVSVAAHQGLDKVAGTPGNRPIIVLIRTALREEGWKKVTGNMLARGAKFLSHGALGFHAALAGMEGREAYKACMDD